MLKTIQALIITLSLIATSFADVIMTELTDPQNSSDAGRYVELYNNGDSDVDLSSGWALLRWTNGNADPQSPKSLDGTITAGGFYIVCNNADKFNATYGLTCDQDVGTGGPADSNGDDNIALVDASGTIVDMFGVAGEDGSGTGHEFEDGRAERAEGATSASAVWNEADWNIDNDSGGGDGNQYAPEGFDPGSWIGEDDGGGDTTCDDDAACNTGETADCTYPDEGYDCNGDCVVEVDCEGTCGGTATVNIGWGNLQWPTATSSQAGSPSENIYGQVWVDGVTGSANPDSGVEAELGYGAESSTPDDSWTWSSAAVAGNDGNNDEFAGQLTIADGGTYSYSYRYRYGSSCWYYAAETGSITVESLQTYAVTFNVDMNHTELSEDGIAVYGLVSWGEGTAMTDEDGDGVYSATVDLTAGDYLYKFKNGGSWENVDELECAVFDDPDGDGWGYWDRGVSVTDADITLDTDCFGACGACVPGCTDPNATNYDENANVDDDSCEYPTVEPDNLFFSEYAEGSSNNKYLEIYNASGADVDLSGYSLSSCSNGCNDGVSWDYPDNVSFDAGTVVAAGDVYVVCHGSSDDLILAECDQTFTYLSNGDDVFGLTQVGTGVVLDIIGTIGDDPGSGWEVAGESNATKDHTLVRDASVTNGNGGDWAASAGSADSSEWLVFDQNTWDFLGSHPHDFAAACDDETACNYGEEGDCYWAEENHDCDGNLLVNVSFHVNMSEQTVDTEGYGLDLYLDNPYGYHDMNDEDGDGVWSVTLTLPANNTYSYKFKNGNEWELNFNDTECGDGSDYGNRYVSVGDSDTDAGPFCFNSCGDCETPCGAGDVNGDATTDVLDVVSIVGCIIDPNDCPEDIACADLNGDGAVNVLDVVAIVNIILNGRVMENDANSAQLIKSNNALTLNADGFIGGIQLTLTHNTDFSLTLNNSAWIADYATHGTETNVVLIHPAEGELFTTSGEFAISQMIVANSQGEISSTVIGDFNLSDAYPNPFNPSTSISMTVPEAGLVSVNVYSITGQLVAELAHEILPANQHTFTWNAENVPSGMYLLRADFAGQSATRKLLLLK